MYSLPFELQLAICAYLRPCQCTSTGSCNGNHPPSAFASQELSALRQTSCSWREAALHRGLRTVTASSRWMLSPYQDTTKLHKLHGWHSHRVRQLVFRASDQSFAIRDDDSLISRMEDILALGWDGLDSVSIEWLSGSRQDHQRIAAALHRYAGNIREVYIRDRAASMATLAPLLMTPRTRRLGVSPYGYNQRWADLAPQERGAAQVLMEYPNQLTKLTVGGADLTPQLLASLHRWQPRLSSLTIEHAWADALLFPQYSLNSLTMLSLENISVQDSLPLSNQMLPRLERLSIRHVWQRAEDLEDPRQPRGAVSLQNERWLADMWAQRWNRLRELSLPAISDFDAQRLSRACSHLQRLTTYSLDYDGPCLTAPGLVAVLKGLAELRHLSIEQRRADGSPGYAIDSVLLGRLLGADDEDTLFSDRLMRKRQRASEVSSTATTPSGSPELAPHSTMGQLLLSDDATDVEMTPTQDIQVLEAMPEVVGPISRSLQSLWLPRATFTASALDALVRVLPALTRLSVTMCGADTSSSLISSKPWSHSGLRWIGVQADEDILTDPAWLSTWLSRRFPALRECSTNHARSHRQMMAELRSLSPSIRFSRLSSRALQSTPN